MDISHKHNSRPFIIYVFWFSLLTFEYVFLYLKHFQIIKISILFFICRAKPTAYLVVNILRVVVVVVVLVVVPLTKIEKFKGSLAFISVHLGSQGLFRVSYDT